MPECFWVESLDTTVTLAPCPSWCTKGEHFPDRDPETADEDFRHYGPNLELSLGGPGSGEASASGVAVAVWARSENLRAAAGPAWVEVNLCNGTGGGPDLWIDLTPAQARKVALTLVSLAEIAETGTRQAD